MATDTGIDMAALAKLIELARLEDLSTGNDITTGLLPESAFEATGHWSLRARRPGRFCGAAILPTLVSSLAPEVRIEWVADGVDGRAVTAGEEVARFGGRVCQMLAAERVILNFVQHLSGVATETARFVTAVAGTHTKIYDTRKTTPGMRTLEKYAVRCGGGHNHRIGLYDAVLIKDNHLAGIPTDRLAHAVFEMLGRIERLPSEPACVEVECDSLVALDEMLKVVGIDVLLLDNFEIDATREAVRRRDAAGLRGKVELEASGGASLETVRAIAETGVDRIAVGAITHSAPALDVGLDAS
jgi:nicotinate-nucleotide pyrophosphorylase (carboxylating)